jgi:hypothetical protein
VENQGVNTRAEKQFPTCKQAYFALRNYGIIYGLGGGCLHIKSNITVDAIEVLIKYCIYSFAQVDQFI